MIQLLRLDQDTVVNPDYIVQVVIQNLNVLRKERRQHHITAEQRERMEDKFWEVSVYIRSGSDGYNPERYTKRFQTRPEAQTWINQKFVAVIVTHL